MIHNIKCRHTCYNKLLVITQFRYSVICTAAFLVLSSMGRFESHSLAALGNWKILLKQFSNYYTFKADK